MAFVSLLFVESRPEEQQDGHDLVVRELCTINLPGAVGKRALLCQVSLVFFPHLIASQRTHVPKQCVWWKAGVESQAGQDKVICPIYTSQDAQALCCHLPEWRLQDSSCLQRLSPVQSDCRSNVRNMFHPEASPQYVLTRHFSSSQQSSCL